MNKIQLYGINKDSTFKVWSVEVTSDDSTAFICIEHGKEGGKLTTKIDTVKSGKQGRTPYQQAVSEANGRLKKQMDKGYRENREELSNLNVLPMLASDFNKVGHRINFPCFTSVKYDGVRAFAIKRNGVVELKSRTGQPYNVPHLEEALRCFMNDGEHFDGEIYLHNYALQDITSAVKRTDPQKEVEKAQKKLDKYGSNPHPFQLHEDLEEAKLIARIRPLLEFHMFDIVCNGTFKDRIQRMDDIHQEKRDGYGEFIHLTQYDWCIDEVVLRNKLHPQSVKDGFEGVMLRNLDGVYESGKRSADLQKYKTFVDEEFLILDVVEDKQGDGVFVLKNNLNDQKFQCVMGDLGQRKAFLLDKHKLVGKWLNVKFQTRYRGTLLPQFPVGQYIRDGYAVEGMFVPYD
jgi:DNA ligase-1